ncbi:FimV/HubP family polar landmark protein, partial [Vibrio sinaloensis]|uniref:FimV/HubP family polar landmark protein n=1 Tax=Photobacterium sp. (strain ATCC 43367) TaxID=379097 RepID=UPI002F3F13FC
YSEEDALVDMASEPEMPAAEQADVEPSAEPADETIELDELDLPEYDEQDALADMFSESSEELSEQDDETSFNLDDIELPDLEDATESVEGFSESEFDVQAFDELLSDTEENQTASFSFDNPIDATTSDSAGMDIDAMLEVGGEDWNGFTLSDDQQAQISDDIPEEEQDIWSQENLPEQAQVLDENWEDQQSLDDFNPRENQFRTIDELMAEVDAEEAQEIDDSLKLDVGLNDFPDVIGDIGSEDVDSNAEAAGKLDLAKIYMEMNDAQGAKKLLEEAIVDGSDEIRREAKRLIDDINRS